MAEFLNTEKPKREHYPPGTGYDAMGQPVPYYRRQAAVAHLIEMGVTDKQDQFRCTEQVCDLLARDKIYEAFDAAMKYVDLIGTYRLVAVLLSASDPTATPPAPRRKRANPARATARKRKRT